MFFFTNPCRIYNLLFFDVKNYGATRIIGTIILEVRVHSEFVNLLCRQWRISTSNNRYFAYFTCHTYCERTHLATVNKYLYKYLYLQYIVIM